MVRAIVLTHGHEDHIGALPYILRDLNVPIYGTQFTLALVRKRLEEHGLLDKTDLREVMPGRTRGDRPVRRRVHPRHAQHDRLRGAGGAHAAGRDHPYRRLQDGSDADRRAALRPARVCAIRPGRRAGAFQRQHQRGAAGLHAVGTRGLEPHRGTVPRGAEKGSGLVLCKLDPAHPAGGGHCRRGRPQSRLRRPQHGGQRGDRAHAWAGCAFPTAWSSGRRICNPSIRKRRSCW